jgi:4-coumarate--CoA ligase
VHPPVIYRDALTSRAYTYAQVKSVATAFGSALRSKWQWQKGDVLAVFSPNSIDIPPVNWGTLWAGGIVSPLNPTSTVTELANLLKDCGAKGLVTQKACLDAALQAAKKAGLPWERILLIGDEKDGQGRVAHLAEFVQPMSAAMFGAGVRQRRERIDPKKDIAFLVYSSGTTGLPKGVMLSHENIVSNALMLQATEGPNLSPKAGRDGQGDKGIAFLPFFHIYGMSFIYSSMTLVGNES